MDRVQVRRAGPGPSPSDGGLPFVDEHQVLVAAPAPAVWQALTSQLTGRRTARAGAFARVLGAEPWRASGTPLRDGATLPGFTVTEAVPGQRLRLAGRHRFSRYALILTLLPQPGGTVLSARTYAEFPGLRGRVYRAMVIGSGAHRVLVPRLLRTIGRRAAAGSAGSHGAG